MRTRRSHNTILGILAVFSIWLLATLPIGAARSADVTMEILVDGQPLPELPTASRTYIEALEGREYSIRLTNRGAHRVAVALSVDGLNTIDAKHTKARAASKWILGPGRSVTLDGWQTGLSTARRFFFTTEEESYGAWLGRTQDLGLIAAAVFREKTTPPAPIARPDARMRKSSAAAPGESGVSSDSPDEMAATGIGREIDHQVRRVEFEAESRPSAVIELRYEYRAQLARLGIMPPCEPPPEDPLARRERSRGFTDGGFAPDPYR